jgi:hypothetical protein
MSVALLHGLARSACALAVAALAGCATTGSGPGTGAGAEEAKDGVPTAPRPAVADFSAGLRCMDNLLLDYGTRDLAVVVEDLPDATGKRYAGTKDMLISAVSDMTRRSRAIRLVPYGQAEGERREGFAAAPQYALRTSVHHTDDTTASALGVDFTLLATQDRTVVPGMAARHQVRLAKPGQTLAGDGTLRKFGAHFSVSGGGAQDGQVHALRKLVELGAMELFGRLAKVPYWTCLGFTDENPEVATEIRDWYDAMAARPAEIIGYFQVQLRMRRIYDGPVDGVVNPQLKEAVASYREALGLSRESKLSQDLLRAYLRANHRELEAKVKRVPAAAQPQAVAQGGGAAPAPVAPQPLALKVATTRPAGRYARGEAVHLTVQPSRQAHVYCFLQDENRRISRFFPNRFRRDSRVDPAQGVQLPGAMRFEIRMNSQGVPETVSCFATEGDVLAQLPQGLNGGDFAPLPVASLEQLRSAFAHAAGGVWAQESLVVRPQ